MTTDHNKTVVRAFVEAVNRQDWRRFDELLAPDFVRHSSTFGQPQIRSRDQLREFLAGEAGTFPDAHETIHFLVAEGDMVAVHSGFRGTQRGPMGSFPASGRSVVRRLHEHLSNCRWSHRRGVGRVGLFERPHSAWTPCATIGTAAVPDMRESVTTPPNHAMQRTRPSRCGCNPRSTSRVAELGSLKALTARR